MRLLDLVRSLSWVGERSQSELFESTQNPFESELFESTQSEPCFTFEREEAKLVEVVKWSGET